MSKIIQDVNLGTNLQKLRKSRGLTQEQLCTNMDTFGRPMLQSTYAQIETGARNIFVSDLIAITRILEVSFDQVFYQLDPIPKNKTHENE